MNTEIYEITGKAVEQMFRDLIASEDKQAQEIARLESTLKSANEFIAEQKKVAEECIQCQKVNHLEAELKAANDELQKLRNTIPIDPSKPYAWALADNLKLAGEVVKLKSDLRSANDELQGYGVTLGKAIADVNELCLERDQLKEENSHLRNSMQ